MFRSCEWNERPREVVFENGKYIVARNVEAVERDGQTFYAGEIAFMDASSYAAYAGAREVSQRREREIVDETVLNLIEEGSL